MKFFLWIIFLSSGIMVRSQTKTDSIQLIRNMGKKNELAFYTLPQLAYLIKNKKISSLSLTRFFIERLKKWGDTLQCIITLIARITINCTRQNS